MKQLDWTITINHNGPDGRMVLVVEGRHVTSRMVSTLIYSADINPPEQMIALDIGRYMKFVRDVMDRGVTHE